MRGPPMAILQDRGHLVSLVATLELTVTAPNVRSRSSVSASGGIAHGNLGEIRA
jgi:hypothetical protein